MGIFGAILVGVSLGSTLFGFARDRKAAKQAKKLAEFEGKMFDEAAEDALVRGKLDTYRVGASARQLAGAQTATQAATGVDVTSGSAAEVMASDRRLADFDILTIENNAELEAHGLRQQGKFSRMGGKNAASAYSNRSYSTLMSGASDLFDFYSRWGLNKSTKITTPRATDNSGGYGQR